MFNVKNITLDKTLKIIMSMLHLLNQASSKRMPISVFLYSAKVKPCSLDVLNGRDILGSPKNGRGRLECARQCTVDISCALVVYQEFSEKFTTCTKMSIVLAESVTKFDFSDSKQCTAVTINPCLNQGTFYNGICLCQDGFTGQACEYVNPSCCIARWTQIANLVRAEQTLYMIAWLAQSFSRATPKLKFRNTALEVTSVMSAMDATNDQITGYWFLLTFAFLEKAAWNRFSNHPRRQFIHLMKTGSYQVLSLNASSGAYSQDNFYTDFAFLAPEELRLAVAREMPNDWALVADDLSDGYGLESFTWTNVDDTEQIVVAQLVDRTLPLYVNEHFIMPPAIRNMIYVLGVQTFKADSEMHSGYVKSVNSGNVRNTCYVNPCWTTVSGGKYSKISLQTGWKMLGTHLRLGRNVRINIGTTYHQVLEVIQTGDNFTLLLAPFLSQNNTATITTTLYGVRSLITSSSMFESCTHQIEGELVIARDKHQTSQKVIWFVDSRKWSRVFAVFSNSSVAYGSVSDLISGVLAGSDARIWIEWLNPGYSRFLHTHMSSVTYDGKVSTESLVTWKTNIGSEVTLSSKCDLQYVLVTSEGRVEIMSFNVLTPGTPEVHRDVMITWFLS